MARPAHASPPSVPSPWLAAWRARLGVWAALASPLAVLGGGAVVPTADAWAQSKPPPDDEDDFDFDQAGDDDDAPAPRKPAPSDDGDEPLPSDEDVDYEDGDDRDDLLGGAEEEDERDERELLAPGSDNAEIFGKQEAKVRSMPPDEEVMAWETYLEKYPNSLYRGRIEERIEGLVESQFQMRIGGRAGVKGSGPVDADQMEIQLTQAIGLDNINPRTRAQLGLLFGFPTYLELDADFEYALKRQVSIHAGMHGRYTGWSFDIGAKYAFVKSTKLNLVATVMADIGAQFSQRVSQQIAGDNADANATQLVVRPQLGLGKVVGPVQLLLTAGAEVLTRANASPALIGGLHVSGRVAPPVAIYAESEFYVRQLGREAGPFNFAVVAVGFKFYPITKRTDDPLEVAMAGMMPVSSGYMQPYLGAVQAQGVYYLDLPYVGGR